MVVAYLLPLIISYFLYDTSRGPDAIFYRIVMFWQTFGIGLHILSASAAVCSAVLWIRCFRHIPSFASFPLGFLTGGAILSVLALLFFGWRGLFL